MLIAVNGLIAVTWEYVAACLLVPIAWGWGVHVLFERIGRRRARKAYVGGRTAAAAATAGPSQRSTGVDATDDDYAPEYQI